MNTNAVSSEYLKELLFVPRKFERTNREREKKTKTTN